MQLTPVNVANPLKAVHTAGEDYNVMTTETGLYQWCGLPSGYGYEAHISSGEGWEVSESAQADALYCLLALDGADHQTAMHDIAAFQFFSPEVLQRCDRENSDIDFSDLEAAPGEAITILNAADLRGELERLASEGEVSPEDYLRCWRAWQVLKETTPAAYYPVIVDRLNGLLSATIPPANGEAGEIGALARATLAAMNSTDLVLDEMRAQVRSIQAH